MQTTGVTATVGSVATAWLEEAIALQFRGIATKIARLNQTVNLTSYKYIKGLVWEYDTVGNTFIKLAISTNNNVTSNSFTASSAQFNSVGQIMICDISSITGNYYIYLYGQSTSTSGADYLGVSELYLTNS